MINAVWFMKFWFANKVTQEHISFISKLLRSNWLHQNWLDDASSCNRTTIQNMQANKPKRAKEWNVIDWPSLSHGLNPIEHAFHLMKTRLKANSPWNLQEQKQYRPDGASPEKIWWSLWVVHFKQSLIAKDFQLNIEYDELISVCVNLSNYL